MTAVLEASGVSKRFGATLALDDVGVRIASGELHAIVGHNGAGKSTLVNILAGAIRPDAGRIALHGTAIDLRSPRDAEASGLGVVHQRLELCENLSVAENIVLGREPKRRPFLDKRAMWQSARDALAQIDAELDVTAPIGALPVAERQLIAIARALIHARDILILDEPTAALSFNESRRLFDLLKTLCERSFAILLVTHRLEEVFAEATRVTVFRGGRVVQTTSTTDLTEDSLLDAMLGRRLEARRGKAEVAELPSWKVEIQSAGNAQPAQELRVREGRITGLLGMPGSGRESLMLALVGRDRSWNVKVEKPDGRPVTRLSPHSRSIGFIPNDRVKYGVFRNLTAHDNIALGIQRGKSVRPLRDRRLERRVVAEQFRLMSVHARGPDQSVNDLSGGNQQKVLVARALVSEPELLILDEPTKGVDVGSREDIYRILRQHAESGRAVLVGSQDEEELGLYCDLIFVVYAGRLNGPLPTPADRHELVALATGGQPTSTVRAPDG